MYDYSDDMFDDEMMRYYKLMNNKEYMIYNWYIIDIILEILDHLPANLNRCLKSVVCDCFNNVCISWSVLFDKLFYIKYNYYFIFFIRCKYTCIYFIVILFFKLDHL